MKSFQPSIHDLNLGGQSAGLDQNCHPRHLLHFQGYIIAYGGDTGVVTAIQTNSLQDESSSPHVIARFDDPVRAVAVSPDDGKRIAFGFDDGSTRIYSYDSPSSGVHHPLLMKRSSADDSTLFSQYDSTEDSSAFMVGPRAEAPIRCMEFHPLSSAVRGYFLAIASEASPGLSIVRIPNKNTKDSKPSEDEEDFKTYLRQEGGDAHNMSGIRSLAFSQTNSTPSSTLLTTLGMDGRMCIWDVSSLEDPGFLWELRNRDSFKIVRKPDVGEWNGSTVADRSYAPVWAHGFLSKDSKDPCLSMLGLPGACDIQVRIESNSQGWEKKSHWLTTTSSEGHTDDVISMAFEPMTPEQVIRETSRLLVSIGRDGKICVWEVFHQVPVFKEDEDAQDQSQDFGRFITQIHMHDPKSSKNHLYTKVVWIMTDNGEKILCLATEDGNIQCLAGKDYLKQLKQLAPITSSKVESSEPSSIPSKRIQKLKEDDGTSITADAFENESINEETPSTKIESSKTTRNAFVDDEASEAADDDVSYEDFIPTSDIADKTNVDTMNEGLPVDDQDFGNNHVYDEEPEAHSGKLFSLPEAQAAFAPSSTPLGFKRRILCWNYKGVVTTRRDDTGNITIDISFTDALSIRPVSFRDNMDFIIGSLGDDGAIFASDIMEDDLIDNDVRNTIDELAGFSELTKSVLKRSERRKQSGGRKETFTGSCIFFYRFETFGNMKDKDWQISLPADERAVGCASGEGWAAVITNRRFLRMFSSGGMQGPVIWLKGEPVTMVGRGRLLAVIYHDGNPLLDGTQVLAYSLYDAVNYKLISTGSIDAISSSGSLTWAGFSNDFSLLIKDSEGMVSMLSCHDPDNGSVWLWTPILDTENYKKSSEDVFWPVSVENGRLTTLHLKGGDKHPDPIRRPVTIFLDLQIPLIGFSSDQGFKLEETSVRASVALRQKRAIDLLLGPDHESETDDLESAYNAMSAQVDKITLKLFFQVIGASKAERAFDIAKRLHLEPSYDIAVEAADRVGLRKLSDRIIAFKESKFTSIIDNFEDGFGHQESTYSSYNEYDSRHVSPETEIAPKSLKRKDLGYEDSQALTSQSSRNVKIKDDISLSNHDDSVSEKKKRFFNPFAKKHMESPAKAPSSPSRKSPVKKPHLSRSSTFSAESRKMSRIQKKIL